MNLEKFLTALTLLSHMVFAAFPELAGAEAPGQVDRSFDPGSGIDWGLSTMALQPDGKLVVGGSFSTVRGLMRNAIARLNPDGSGDPVFDALMPEGSSVACIALQPDGKLLIGGAFSAVRGFSRNGIARLNTDGTLDLSFNPGAGIEGPDRPEVLAMVLQSDGKLLIGGRFNRVNGESRDNIARLNPDGSVDGSFNGQVTGNRAEVACLALQPDGKVLVGGNWEAMDDENVYGITRLNGDGTLDYTFWPQAFDIDVSYVGSIALQPDGKMIVGSFYLTYLSDGTSYITALARLNRDGSPDFSFNFHLGLDGPVTSVAQQPDGKILIAGYFDTIAGTNHVSAARLQANGLLDTSFAPVLGGSVLGLQPDGMVLVQSSEGLVRLTTTGRLDSSFVSENAAARAVFSLGLQSDGKLLIGGDIWTGHGTNRTALGRLNPDGSVDPTFNVQTALLYGLIPDRGVVYSTLMQADGKVLIGGHFNRVNGQERTNVARLNSDGSVDASFQPVPISSEIFCMTLQTDGQVLLGGIGNHRVPVVRLDSSGSIDTSFYPPLVGVHPETAIVRGILLQPDGKLLVGGTFDLLASPGSTNVARLNQDGSLDGSFSANFGLVALLGEVRAIALQPDGKVLIAGVFSTVGGGNRTNVARLNADGTLDETFAFNPGRGIYGISPAVWSIALQPDGKVLIGRDAYASPTNVLRLNWDGSQDSSFQLSLGPSNGSDLSAYALALQPDGRLFFGGRFSSANGTASWNVARCVAGIPPEIRSQPQDQSVTEGDSAVFTVSATGDPPLSFQWCKDGTSLSGATKATLTLSNVLRADAGLYWVLVSNVFGSVASSNATLRVELPDPSAMLERLRDVVLVQVSHAQPLRASLDAALAAIQRHDLLPAIHQLRAFEQKVRAQIQPSDLALARRLIQAAEEIVDVLSAP